MDAKGYTTSKVQHGWPHRRKLIFTGSLVLVVLAAWLLWREWQQQEVQPRLVPPARNKIVRPIPSPPPGTVGDSDDILISSKQTDVPAPERQLITEVDLPASSGETNSSADQETDGDSSQSIPLTTDQGEKDNTPESPSAAAPDNEMEETVAPKDSFAKRAQEEFVVQVGAFRNLTEAQSLENTLTEKGYDAYLNGQTLPELGLVYRVRIRGYSTVSEAREEMERLHKEEGLDSFLVRIESDQTAIPEE